MFSAEQQLHGSPYLIPEGEVARKRFNRASESSIRTRSLAVATNDRIRTSANELLEPYTRATRAELVTESNRIEGYVWDPSDVRRVIADNLPLLGGSEHALTEIVKADRKLYEVLGLYRAHELADAWWQSAESPRASHIRELHRVILGGVHGSGAYKQFANEISGRSDHKTTDPIDVPREMARLADWWSTAEGDPLLTATVVHAWLAHIHPFSDGNGRLARVLANLELTRNSYAPLILSAAGDRGEYYDALKESDDGDILPLYELFEKAIRRQSKTMARVSYLEEIIDDRLLVDETYRFQLWSAALATFTTLLETAVIARGWVFKPEGELGLKSFALLGNRDFDGNGWYATVGPRHGAAEWLLWFGFKSEEWRGIDPHEREGYPSIFVSRRDNSSGAPHPFRWEPHAGVAGGSVPDEVRVVPLRKSPVQVRYGVGVSSFDDEGAAEYVADALVGIARFSASD